MSIVLVLPFVFGLSYRSSYTDKTIYDERMLASTVQKQLKRHVLLLMLVII